MKLISWITILAIANICVTVQGVDNLELPAIQPKKSMFVPDVAKLSYGKDERQIISIYRAANVKNSPVLLYIHGGGWKNGNGVQEAADGKFDKMIWDLTSRGITVAFVNYRLSKLPDPVFDAARAVQFLRYHASELDIDKSRFVATGFSAGATTSLWLALHDDLAEPNSSDPIARESTRLRGAVGAGAQTSIDPVALREWGLLEAVNHYMISGCMGFKNVTEMDANYESKKAMYKEFSPITHIDANDPEIRIYATDLEKKGNWIHHGIFGAKLKEEADKKGAKCEAVGITPKLKDRRDNDYIERILKEN